MPPVIFNPWETHQCDIPIQDCNWKSQYWNKLACQCFNMIQCKMMCAKGSEMIPTESCTCAPIKDIRTKFYPAWATDEDISNSKSLGIAYAGIRPVSWKVCPREEQLKKCSPGFFWNELACECFSAASCKRIKGCDVGYSFDPRPTCGDCMSAQQIGYLYPKWATPFDVVISTKDGYNYVET